MRRGTAAHVGIAYSGQVSQGGSFQFDKDSLGLLREALERMEKGFSSLPAFEPPHVDEAAIRNVLLEVAELVAGCTAGDQSSRDSE